MIQRPKDKSDPDPKISTVLPHIWPLMLIVTLAKLTTLTLAAGLLGPFIFLGLALLFLINFAALYTCCRNPKRRDSVVNKSEEDPENIPLRKIDKGSKQKLKIGKEQEEEEEEGEGEREEKELL